MKKTSTVLILISLIFLLTNGALAYRDQYLNQIGIDFNLEPANDSSMDYLPFEQLADYYGISYHYDQKNNKIQGRSNHTSFILNIGSKVAEISNKRRILDNPVARINGHTMVPTEFMESLLKINFRWSASGPQIIIKPITDFQKAIKVYLYTNKSSYRFGEQVVITMIIKNTTGFKINVPLRSSQIYDLTLTYNHRHLWSWSADKIFTSALSNLEFAPNESKVYTFTLPDELILTPAEYQINGLMVSNPQILSDEYYFTIK